MAAVDRRSADDPEGVAALVAEADRLRWLGGRVAAPEVVAFEHEGTRASLVTTAIAGTPASDPVHRVEGLQLATAVGAGLRAIHDVDPADCPFDERLVARRAVIERRVSTGLVDRADLSEPYRRHDPDQLLALWWRGEPTDDEDLVVTHGDYTLGNVRIGGGEVVGVEGWRRCGVADRYVDLAVAARSLADAVGPELTLAFFDAYGVTEPSLTKIDFYALAAELLP